jgi:UDP-N-acetylmuramoyl-tripeptide--D-alanyl-D-alanine ligase
VAKILDPIFDWVRHGGDARTKALYRRPVIEAARLWRRFLTRTCFIGVTGSAGKTTTKDLLHAALAARFRSAKNSDSHNVLYPIARTLLTLGPGVRFCVQEIGAGEPGGFDAILPLLKPQVGVVTNVGTDHYRVFRGRAGVAAEKGKLIASLPVDGLAVLNADDPLVIAMASRCRARVVTYGMQSAADFRAEILSHRWPDRLSLRLQHRDQSVVIPTQLLGAQHAGNVLAAVATACSLGVALEQAALAAGRVCTSLGRMSVHETARGVTFIRDDLKAPHWTMSRALQFMAEARASRKLIVLGTISDYAGASFRPYRDALSEAAKAADRVLLVGPQASGFVRRLSERGVQNLHAFESVRHASAWLQGFLTPGDLVLLKGSNKADHLARLPLALDQDVRCWRARCGWEKFCDHCRQIGQSASP